MVETEKGRIAVGWLIVEDLAMVLALVLLPALFGGRGDEANGAGLLQSAELVALKVVGFVAFMLIVARRILPAVLHLNADPWVRELFRLAVLVLGVGGAVGAGAGRSGWRCVGEEMVGICTSPGWRYHYNK